MRDGTGMSPSATPLSKKTSAALTLALALYAASTLFSMAAMSIFAAVAALVLLIALASPKGFCQARRLLSTPFPRKFFFLSVALAAACLISLITARLYPLSYGGNGPHISFAKDMAKAWYLFWPLVLFVALRCIGPEKLTKVVNTWLVVAVVLSALGLVQYFTGFPRPQPIPGNPGKFHVTLFLGHHLSVASIFIFPFFVLLEMSLLKRWRPWAGLGAFLVLLALVGTYSRMLWVSLPVGIFVWLCWAMPRRYRVVAVVLLALGLGVVWQQPVIQTRVKDTIGIASRVDLWRANWEFFKHRPITGVGWHHNLELAGRYFESKFGAGTYFVGHAHNNAIEMLGSTGVLGFIAWLTWVVVIFAWSRKCRAVAGGPFWGRAWICAWLVFHLNGLTQVNFWESKVLHQVAWVVALILFTAATQLEQQQGKTE